MDHQLFWVKVRGGAFGRKETTRVLRVLESSISVASVSYNIGAAKALNSSVEFMFDSISNILPSLKSENELTLNVPDASGRSYETIHIFCESRSDLITTLLNKMDDLNGIGTDFSMKKHTHQSGGLVDTVLRVRSVSLVKMLCNGLRRANSAKKINFNDIEKVQRLTDDENIILLHLRSRILKLSVPDITPFMLALTRNMKFYLNRELRVENIDTSTMVDSLATYIKRVKAIPYLFEFQVLKLSELKAEERKREVYVSRDHFIEMSGDEAVAVHRLNDIIGLVVSEANSNEITVEFKSSHPTQYFIADKDSFVASISDAAATIVDIRPVAFFQHMLPDQTPAYQLEQETYFLNRFVSEMNTSRDHELLHTILKEFASNVHVGKSQCSDYRAVCAAAELLKDWTLRRDFVRSTTCCIVISRLLGSRYCFESLKNTTTLIPTLFQCMRSENAVLAYTSSVTLKLAFIFSGIGQQADTTIFKQEQANRLLVLSLENMQQIVTLLQTYSLKKGHILQAYGLVKLLAAGLEKLSLDSEITKDWFKGFESCIMALTDVICVFSRSNSSCLRESTAELLEAILAKTSSIVSNHFRNLSLKRCLVILHLKNAFFSRTELSQLRSTRLVFHMIEGNQDSKRLLRAILPKGAFDLYDSMALKMIQSGKDKFESYFCSWVKLLNILRSETVDTPLFMWNDLKRAELQKFLDQEMQGFSSAASSNHSVNYDSSDVSLVYSSRSEGEGTVVSNLHLELLVDHPPTDDKYSVFWKVPDPLALFQGVFQALVLGFTPFFGHNNIPEVDLRLGVHVLTWIYERNASEVSFSLQNSNVIEASVGMLQEVLESEHQVFVFKLVVFLLTMLETGGRENVLRFIRAGGTTVLISMLVSSLAECCQNKSEFESDGWSSRNSANSLETVHVVGIHGEVRLARVPSGKLREALDKASVNGSLDARDAIKWQDVGVPPKIQFGMALDMLEALLRLSGGEKNVESFPPSAACLSLSREDVLCHLVQSLLRAKSPAFGRILNIILQVVRMNNHAVSNIHKLGTFDILLWKLMNGDITIGDRKLIVTFLLKLHSLQVSDSPNQSSSIICSYLPEGIVQKLASEEAGNFLTLLDSERDDPEVVWSETMREKLSTYLSQKLEPYVRARSSDSRALYVHVPGSLSYEQLSGTVFSPPFYLHNLLDTERFPNYPITDPVKFLNNLIKDLRSLSSILFWRKENLKIHFLLSSLAHLLQIFPKILPPVEMELVVISLATPALKLITDSSCINIILQTTKILLRMSSLTFSESNFSSASVSFALSVIYLEAIMNSDSGFPTGQLELAIAGAFLVLEVACRSRPGRDFLRVDERWQRGMWWALCSAASDTVAEVQSGPSPISFAALDCLKHLTIEEHLHIFKQGFHLSLLLLSFSSACNDCKPALLYSAAMVLRSLLENDSSLMKNLIPEPLLVALADPEGPEHFLSMQASELTLPAAIWSSEAREELRDRVYNRLCSRGADENTLEDELEWLRSFNYECLSEELVIEGFFVKGLISCSGFIPETSLINSLLDFLVEHSEVVSCSSDMRSSFWDYISALEALENCIRLALELNMEEDLKKCRFREFSSALLELRLDMQVQIHFASIVKLLSERNLVEIVFQSRLLELLTLQLWEALSEEVLSSTLEALQAFAEHLPATLTGTNYFLAHGTLLPLVALFCGVNTPVLRGSKGSPVSKPSSGYRVAAGKILGQLLLAAKGVSRRSKLLRDLEDLKLGAGEVDETTDMYELLAIVEQSSLEDSKLVRSLLVLFPIELLSLLARDPTQACRVYDENFSGLTHVWDESRRHQVKSVIVREAARVRALFNHTELLPAWSLESERAPVFLRWVLVVPDDNKQLYRQDAAENYAPELYLGGFYVDQFLQSYKSLKMKPLHVERFIHELRTGIVIGKLRGGEELGFHDRRRMLLGLLLLARLHPELLSSRSNIDIFLPLFEFLSGTGAGEERRALAQPVLLLLHSAATNPDTADCVISEELIYTLASFLSLEVPPGFSGDPGTDPRLCCLILLLRLLKLSSHAVEIVLRLGVMLKLEELALEYSSSTAVKRKASECLTVMCFDRRKGQEAERILRKRMPGSSWKLPPSRIQDEAVEFSTLEHFLEHLNPSPWWTAEVLAEEDDDDTEATVVEASFCFARARMSDFDSEAEIIFGRCIAPVARVSLRDVRVLRKRITGSIVMVDLEVLFRKYEQQGVRVTQEISAGYFKDNLEKSGCDMFLGSFLESTGAARVASVSLRSSSSKQVSRQNSWQNGATVRDKNIIYMVKTNETQDQLLQGTDTSEPEFSRSLSTSQPSPAPSVNHNPALRVPPPPPLPPARALLHRNGARAPENGAGTANGKKSTNGTNGHASSKLVPTDGPVLEVASRSNGIHSVKADDRRKIEESLELALEGAEITKENLQAAKLNFLEAFEDETDELDKMIERYSKLIQKYPLQPQLCYNLMAAWEENCLDLMSGDELAKYGRSIAAFDICRYDDPESAAQEARRKFQGILKIRREAAWKEKSKQLKGDISAELAKAVVDRKERVDGEVASDELRSMSKGKIKKLKQEVVS